MEGCVVPGRLGRVSVRVPCLCRMPFYLAVSEPVKGHVYSLALCTPCRQTMWLFLLNRHVVRQPLSDAHHCLHRLRDTCGQHRATEQGSQPHHRRSLRPFVQPNHHSSCFLWGSGTIPVPVSFGALGPPTCRASKASCVLKSLRCHPRQLHGQCTSS